MWSCAPSRSSPPAARSSRSPIPSGSPSPDSCASSPSSSHRCAAPSCSPESPLRSFPMKSPAFSSLAKSPKTWLVTGCAGFIGSNLIERLLRMGQNVVGLDNFSTGFQHNLDQVEEAVGPEAWSSFRFIEGDIRDLDTCREACKGAAIVLHQAALGSVPLSLDD